MTTTLSPDIAQDIDELTRQVFENVLGLSAEPGPSSGPAPTVTSSVQIMGGWSGAVSLRMSAELATLTAALMFDAPGSTLEPDEIDDAVGEMANMIGGNVKSLLPEPSQLSLPTVSAGDEPPSFPGTVLVEHLEFDVAGQPFTVSVLEASGRTDQPPSTAAHRSEP